MNTARKYAILWGLVLIFIGLDVWLLVGRTGMRKQINRLQSRQVLKSSSLSILPKSIRFTPPIQSTNDPKPPLRLVAVFTDYGCADCLKAEINQLNRWNSRFKHTLRVYLIGKDKNFLKHWGAVFSYKTIPSAKGLFSYSLPIGSPLVVLVDENGDVQAIHTNDTNRPGSNQRRVAFYKRMRSLFQSVYGSNRQTEIRVR